MGVPVAFFSYLAENDQQYVYAIPVVKPKTISDTILQIVKMSSKPKINIDKALRELEISQRFEQADFTLTELTYNLPLKASDQYTNKSGQHSQESKKSARKSVKNKENQLQFDLKKVKNITYTTLSKTLQQKNHLIQQQKYQIDVLKKCVEEVKASKQHRQTEESRVNSEELAKLKLKEQNYLQNLREIKLLKGNLEEIRKRYEQMLQEKNTIVAKYNALLGEHQQLTLSNAHLKLEKQALQQNTRVIDLEEEIATLKEQLRKEYQQRESIQARSANFQKRLSEYIVKFNESQEHYNTCQIKYYKLQKQCDNFRVDKEDIQQRYSNMQRQCIGEREVHQEEAAKLRAKLKRSEELVSDQEKYILSLKQFQSKTSLEGEEVQRISMGLKKSKEENARLQEENQEQVRKWENYIKQLTKQYTQQKEHFCQQINHFKTLYNQSESAKKAHEECILQLQQFKSKCVDLMNENQRIFNHYNSQLFQKEEEVKRSRGLLSYLQLQIEEKNRRQEQIAERINLLQAKLTKENEYFNANIILQEEVSSLSTLLQQTKQHHSQELVQKCEQIQQLTERNLYLSQELAQSYQKNFSFDTQVEKIKQIQEKYSNEMRYYQEKYQRQLQQYNSLSKCFHQTESENADLVKTKTLHIIQISNLKGQIAQLQTQMHRQSHNNDKRNLCAQISSITNELHSLKQEISFLIEESSQNQAIIDHLKSQNGLLTQKLTISETNSVAQLSQKQQAISKIKSQLEIHVDQVRNLNTNISIIQEKYRSLSQQFQREQLQWNEQKAYLQMQWARLHESNDEEMRELYNSRTTAQYELDNSQNTIAILKRENQQLQKIFSEEIQRRNGIIRQLIKQKKSLYGQFMTNSDF